MQVISLLLHLFHTNKQIMKKTFHQDENDILVSINGKDPVKAFTADDLDIFVDKNELNVTGDYEEDYTDERDEDGGHSASPCSVPVIIPIQEWLDTDSNFQDACSGLFKEINSK